MNNAAQDWTNGVEAIVYQRCGGCGHAQYFLRRFCSVCGDQNPTMHNASGNGIVYATSLVHRAATPETRAHVPYMIVLVDVPEGFRMMAHGDPTLVIGDRVAARFAQFAGRLVPYFERTPL